MASNGIVLNLSFSGCYEMSLQPDLQIIQLDCSEEDKLYIDAPNATSLVRSDGSSATVLSISYLPSLDSCDTDMLYCLYDLASPEVKEQLDELSDLKNRIETYSRLYEVSVWAVLRAIRGTSHDVYMNCYHQLGQQGRLLPPRRIIAKSARSSS